MPPAATPRTYTEREREEREVAQRERLETDMCHGEGSSPCSEEEREWMRERVHCTSTSQGH